MMTKRIFFLNICFARLRCRGKKSNELREEKTDHFEVIIVTNSGKKEQKLSQEKRILSLNQWFSTCVPGQKTSRNILPGLEPEKVENHWSK